MKTFLSTRRGQTTTEMVLLFPVLVVFLLFIIKIFGLLVLSQKMQIAGNYAARRYQLQSHVTPFFAEGWDKRMLQKDIKRQVEEYVGFNNPGMRQFLSLNDLKMTFDTRNTWQQITLVARTKPPRIAFLCKYDKNRVCGTDSYCFAGYNFLCENGAEFKVIKYTGPNERPAPFIRPEGK